ncbi:MAG: DUF4417 domain-containing protein [Butyrivibrio sp.]|nr:DUF4417 domain-containing protein [Butyrivibrio sp.]
MDKIQLLLRNRYKTDGIYEIPKLRNNFIRKEEIFLMGCDHINSKKCNEDKTIHFFLEDYKFERFYYDCDKYIEKLAKYKALLTPDFSLYPSMPLPLQRFSIFKNRWCGAFWQEYGLKVIPTITWGDKRSYSFCFKGVEKHSIVAVSTFGQKREKQEFMLGYDAMLERIEPLYIICFGEPFAEMRGDVLYARHSFEAKKRGCA